MPYIKKQDRELFTISAVPDNAGELNYAFTFIIEKYLQDKKELRYQVINDILGALEGAKQEFYRRIAVPYEEFKRNLNGDVYQTVEKTPSD